MTFTLGEESYRSDMSDPAIVNVIELAKGFYEEGVAVLPTAAGTGPMHMIHRALGCSYGSLWYRECQQS